MELADRLPFCPRCAYPFTGLPQTHQCPECGLPYDGESRMWVVYVSGPRLDRFFMIVVSGLVTLFGLFQVFIFRTRTQLLLGMINILLGAGNFHLIYRGLKKKMRFIAVMPDGLWYVSRYYRVLSIPWSEIKSAEAQLALHGSTFQIQLWPRGSIKVPPYISRLVDVEDAAARINARALWWRTGR